MTPAPLVLRVRSQTVIMRAFAALMFLFTVGDVVESGAGPYLFAMVPVATFIAVAGWRFGWIGVAVTREGLRVRNVLKTHNVPWGQIERFGIGARGQSRMTCWIVLYSGEVVAMHAMTGPDPGVFPRSTATRRNYDSLNAALDRVRAGQDPLAGP